MITLKQLIEAQNVQGLGDEDIKEMSYAVKPSQTQDSTGIMQFIQDYGINPASAALNIGIGAVTGIPFLGSALQGLGGMFKPRSALDQYMLDSYGGYGDMGLKDKFGYNIINAANNYMVPGSSSYRSHQLEALRGLDQNVANQFYLDNYGKTYDQVYSDAQQKTDPFSQDVDVGSGADYYGGPSTQETAGPGYDDISEAGSF